VQGNPFLTIDDSLGRKLSSNTAFFEATIQQVETSKLYFVSYLNYKSFEFPFPLYQVTRMCLRYGNAI